MDYVVVYDPPWRQFHANTLYLAVDGSTERLFHTEDLERAALWRDVPTAREMMTQLGIPIGYARPVIREVDAVTKRVIRNDAE